MLNAGDILDSKYEVIKAIGRGGMGTVYLCKNMRLGSLRAVKELENNASNSRDLSMEWNVLKNLDHPGIPRIIDIFDRDDKTYIIQDYIEGDTLENTVRKSGSMQNAAICDIALKLCDILQYIHSLDPPVIHRDLKPSNILLTPSGRVFLIDFGIAGSCGEENKTDMFFMGSRGYAAPEQYEAGKLNIRTDIYGLGAVLYYMASAKSPELLPPILEDTPGLDKSLGRIIKKAMEIKPDDRYGSIGDVKKDIYDLQESCKISVIKKNETTGDSTKTLVMKNNSLKKSRLPKKMKKYRRNMLLILTITLVFFIVMLSVEYIILKSNKSLSKSKSSTAGTVKKAPEPETGDEDDNNSSSKTADTYREGSILTKAPIFLNEDNIGKSSGNERGVFFEVKPLALAGRFENKYTMEIDYVEVKGERINLYCGIQNNTGSDISLDYDSTFLNIKDSYITADSYLSTDSLTKNGTGKNYIKISFENINISSKSIMLKTRTSSVNSMFDNVELNLKINIK